MVDVPQTKSNLIAVSTFYDYDDYAKKDTEFFARNLES